MPWRLLGFRSHCLVGGECFVTLHFLKLRYFFRKCSGDQRVEYNFNLDPHNKMKRRKLREWFSNQKIASACDVICRGLCTHTC